MNTRTDQSTLLMNCVLMNCVVKGQFMVSFE
jgi:hypothetical protein